MHMRKFDGYYFDHLTHNTTYLIFKLINIFLVINTVKIDTLILYFHSLISVLLESDPCVLYILYLYIDFSLNNT